VRDIVIQGGKRRLETPNIVNKCIDNGYMFLFRGMHTTNSARKYAKRIKGMGKDREAQQSGRDLRRRIQRQARSSVRVIE
jgi:hypothetical protein